MKKCPHGYLMKLGPRCVDCLLVERDALKAELETLKRDFDNLMKLNNENIDRIEHWRTLALTAKEIIDFTACYIDRNNRMNETIFQKCRDYQDSFPPEEKKP